MHLLKLEPCLSYWNEKRISKTDIIKKHQMNITSAIYLKQTSMIKRILLHINDNEYITLDCQISYEASDEENQFNSFTINFDVCYFVDEISNHNYTILYLKEHLDLLKELKNTLEAFVKEVEDYLRSNQVKHTIKNWLDEVIDELEHVTEEDIQKAQVKEEKINPIFRKKMKNKVEDYIEKNLPPALVEELMEGVDRSLDSNDQELFHRLAKELKKYKK